ncbi:MAG: hypothetical protein ACI8RZ_007840 [Myxococcota bacterium]|jgi:hypothetical protein
MMNLDNLAALSLGTDDERSLLLGDLWSEKPAVMVWLRHFG